MQTMSGLDGAFLHLETKETPMHVASLHLFDLPAGYAGSFHRDVRQLMAAGTLGDPHLVVPLFLR